MKQDLNPCGECGGAAAIRHEAGVAVAACANCGQEIGPFDADDSNRAAEIASKARNAGNPVSL